MSREPSANTGAKLDAKAALNPRASFVVEACAGSGKTWLLVSRIIRVLLNGVPPGGILAITFTRKAAREIEARLASWLRDLATKSEQQVCTFLFDRGLSEADARAALPRARRLLQEMLDAQPPITVTTFHGWFARIVGAAPLTSGLAGMTLVESARSIVEEAWQQFARHCAGGPDSDAASSLRWLLGEIGIANTRAMLGRFLARRAEWHAHCEGRDLGAVIEELRAYHNAREPEQLKRGFVERFRGDLQDFAGRLVANQTQIDLGLGNALQRAGGDVHAQFEAAREALLTQKGEPRSRTSSKAMERRLGADGAARFLALHAVLAQGMRDVLAQIADAEAFELDRHALVAGSALLEIFERHKRDRRLMDFADLEWHADRLLSDESEAGFIQARLDARYRHILLDEFQDTNPLQWRILRAWLGAYDSTQEKPFVFMVGDPKQSIYRFRRAEPRVFGSATAFFATEYAATLLPNDVTFRNAPAIVDVVNELFAEEPLFDFRRQSAWRTELPGRVEVLAPIPVPESGPAADRPLRNPLLEPAPGAQDLRYAEEAALLARRIGEIAGKWEVSDEGRRRAARYDDVLVLCRRRTRLAEYERALRDAGIPYVASSRGGLLKTLEADDLRALLRFLASPADDLALAHALRTPLFALSDGDLLRIARIGEPKSSWWARLGGLAVVEAPEAAASRAFRLLGRWLALAGRLPVHDLLDRIYHEGEIVARTRAVVPAAAWPSVAANLEAFIAASLQLDAARYPSLPRFIDELARLADSEDEAPDEGLIEQETGEQALGRVRIMTIHGAKGLEAPIVWLIDAHSTQVPADAYRVLVDWPPQSDQPTHFSFAGRKDALGTARAGILAAEAEAAEREDLNLLYVALTRATQYVFVSGVEESKPGRRASAWRKVAEAVERLAPACAAHGAPARHATSGTTDATATTLPDPTAVVASQAVTARTAVGVRRARSSETQRYGERLHALLEARTCVTGGRTVARSDPHDARDAPIQRQADAMLASPDLQQFFDPACYLRAFNEIELSLADGAIGRIDRLVECPDGWWVIDYKSGSPAAATLDEYRRQVLRYREAVAQMFPDRRVRAVLILGNGGRIDLG